MNLSIQSNYYIITMAVIGLIITLYFSYRQWRFSPLSKTRIILMESLRFIVLLLISFTLLRPELVFKTKNTNTPEIAIIYDISDSMKTKDIVISEKGKTFVMKRNDWIKEQLKKKFYAPLEKKFKVNTHSFAIPINKNGKELTNGTDINYAISKKLANYKNLRSVILITDGGWNFGSSPIIAASKLRQKSIPVFALAAGSSEYLPDLILEKVKPPAFCLANEKISIPFQVKSRMNYDVSTTISLSSEYGVEKTQKIIIPANENFYGSILWQPKKLGTYNMTLKIPEENAELIPENNRYAFNIQVKHELLKVLIIETLPRWEYRFLRNALMRDPGIQVNTLLLHPDLDPGDGENYIQKFPTKENLGKFDVIFLGDIGLGTKELTKKQLKLIEGLVKYQGSGLVLLPGYQGKQFTLKNTPINDMYPVIMDNNNQAGITSIIPSKIILSNEGRNHFLTMLADSPSQNAIIWKNLPAFSWNAAVASIKPGGLILAERAGLHSNNSKMPILVTREYGNGNVLFMGIDSAWKWRKGVEDKYHYRFWGQVVRWMAHKRHLAENNGIRCFFVPEIPRAGKTTYIYASVHDRLNRPLNKANVNVNINAENQKQNINLKLNHQKSEWGVYKGNFIPESSGNYNIKIQCPENGATLKIKINIPEIKRELIGTPVEIKTLKEITNITRGKIFMPENINKIISQINSLPKQTEIEKRFLLWTQWWWAAIIILLLSSYWSIRKFFGLL